MGIEGTKPRGHLGFRAPKGHGETCLRPGCRYSPGLNGSSGQLPRGVFVSGAEVVMFLRNERSGKEEPNAGPDSSCEAILKENSFSFFEDISKDNYAFIHQGRAFGWKIRNPRWSLLGETAAL